MSRSGDECVVALTDQWYLEYGEVGIMVHTCLLAMKGCLLAYHYFNPRCIPVVY